MIQSNIEFLYEELRKATDGGSESMTHDDALKQIEYWRGLYREAKALAEQRDTLRSKLDALEAQEPVATIANASGGFRIDNHAPDILEAGMKLYLAAKPTVRELSNYEICAIAKETESAEPGRDGYILPVSFARAVLAAARIAT
jgi:hypothetical protein